VCGVCRLVDRWSYGCLKAAYCLVIRVYATFLRNNHGKGKQTQNRTGSIIVLTHITPTSCPYQQSP